MFVSILHLVTSPTQAFPFDAVHTDAVNSPVIVITLSSAFLCTAVADIHITLLILK